MKSSVFKVSWRVADQREIKSNRELILSTHELVFSTKDNALQFENNLQEAASFLGKIFIQTSIREIALEDMKDV